MSKIDRRSPMVKAMEAIAERMGAEGSSAARQLQAEVNQLRIKAEALDRMAQSRSPLDTAAAHQVKVAAKARQLDKEVTAALNRCGVEFGRARQAAEARIVEKVNLKTNKYEMIVLQRFANMPEEDRLSTLSQMVKDNHGPELAAIFEAPPFVSGVAPQHIAALRAQMIETHASQEVAEIASLDDAFESVTTATRAAGTLVKELTDPNKLAEIERAAREAEEAAAGFDQTFQSAA